jgi:endoglucanase
MPFQIRRGTNISHWLSQSQARGDERRERFREDDASRLAQWGFDHVRLPIDEVQMWTDAGDREHEAFDLLAEAIEWCAGVDLRVIVDLHILRSHHFNDAGARPLFTERAEQDRFADLWRDLSAFLRDSSTDMLAYELLNEPVAEAASQWNDTYRLAYDAVRSNEPERVIVLGSNEFNRFHSFPDLDVPDDPHLVLSFHYYNPMFITHYTAPWWRAGGDYSGPIRYPGAPIPESQKIDLARFHDDGLDFELRYFDREIMKSDMQVALKVAEASNVPLHCGEFGCYQHTPEDIRESWYRDIRSVFDELGIVWTNWDFMGHFGLVDVDRKETAVRSWLMD